LVAWSEHVERTLCPGETARLADVRLRRIPGAGARAVAGSGIVIEVTSEPVGTRREASYCLYTEPDVFVAAGGR
jgi:hypothetical protein